MYALNGSKSPRVLSWYPKQKIKRNEQEWEIVCKLTYGQIVTGEMLKGERRNGERMKERERGVLIK